MRMKSIKQSISINVSSQRMWAILLQNGDVGKFHTGVRESHSEDDSGNAACLGGKRVCHIVDMGLHITLK